MGKIDAGEDLNEMSFCQTASLVETGADNYWGLEGSKESEMGAACPLLRGLFDALVGLVHVFDVSLEKKKIRR